MHTTHCAAHLEEGRLRNYDIILAEPEHLGQPGCLASNHASQARNPTGSQITPFCHQMCRHATIWSLPIGPGHRIPARISLVGWHPFNLNFFKPTLDPKNRDMSIFCGKKLRRATRGRTWGPWGPCGCVAIPARPMWLCCNISTTHVAVLPYHYDPCGCVAIPSRPMWLCCHTITTHVAVVPYHHDPWGPMGLSWGPKGPHGAAMGPLGAQRGPKGPKGSYLPP